MLCAALPLPAGLVTSSYGVRELDGRPDLHTGVDIAAAEGTPVFAVLPGTVVTAAPSGQVSGYGNVVVLQHGPNVFTLYAHLSAMAVQLGQAVELGQQLGSVGRSAGTRSEPTRVFSQSGSHLHLEFLSKWPPTGKDLDRIDPGPVLAQLGIILPKHGPLTLACGGERTTMATVARSGAGGLLVVLAALAVARALKAKRRP